MLKKILIILMIVVLGFSLVIYATDVPASNSIDNTIQSGNDEDTTKDEDNSSKDDENEEKDTNTNTNTDKNGNNNNSNKNNNTSSGNKTNTTNKGQSQSTKNETTSAKKSKDADLKDLKIDIEGMTPEFNKNVTEYYLTVDLSVEQVKVTAVPVDEKAKVTVIGNKNLKDGKNIITVTVKAGDGTVKKYYIYVTKVDDVERADAELKLLEITNYDLTPKFKTNIYNYNLNIGDDIQSLEINAVAEKEKAKIDIEGNNDLQEGENIIKIKVTAEDGETTRIYKINAYITSGKVEIKQESKLPAIILLIITGSGIVVLGAFLILKKTH